MKCPFCHNQETRVTNSRTTDRDEIIRRRRECRKCLKRFTTLEKIEESLLFVVKKDGHQEIFDRHKLLSGLLRAVEKRPISREQCEKLIDKIEANIKNQFSAEITSRSLGELVLKELKRLDKVSYIRFASVYREFKDLSEFTKELEGLSADR